ncbi:MAG: fibronectin type III domain-containing protein [Chloroflexota bacterium]
MLDRVVPTRRTILLFAAVGLMSLLATLTSTEWTGAQTPPTAPTEPGVPSPPTDVSATPGDAQITVEWAEPDSEGDSPITSYTASCTRDGRVHSTTVDDSERSADVTGLSNGSEYTCWVVATNDVGDSVASEQVTATPFTVPSKPVGVTGRAGDTEIFVEWREPRSDGGSSIESYTVTCDAMDSSDSGEATVPADSDSDSDGRPDATVTGLENGVRYMCTVVATNAAGDSQSSPPSGAKTPGGIPSAPGQPSVTPGNGQMTVDWTAPENNGGRSIQGYRVRCATDLADADSGVRKAVGGDAASTTVAGLANGAAYQCEVVAANSIGQSDPSESSETATPANVPGAPLNVSTRANAPSALQVSWKAPKNNGGSSITSYEASCQAGTSTPVTAEQSDVNPGLGQRISVGVTGLTSGETYDCSVTAENAVGQGPSSQTATATPQGVPSEPQNVTAAPGVGAGEIDLDWDAPADSGGASITRYHAACENSIGQSVAATNAGTTSVTIEGMAVGEDATCSVSARNRIGVGEEATADPDPVQPGS